MNLLFITTRSQGAISMSQAAEPPAIADSRQPEASRHDQVRTAPWTGPRMPWMRRPVLGAKGGTGWRITSVPDTEAKLGGEGPAFEGASHVSCVCNDQSLRFASVQERPTKALQFHLSDGDGKPFKNRSVTKGRYEAHALDHSDVRFARAAAGPAGIVSRPKGARRTLHRQIVCETRFGISAASVGVERCGKSDWKLNV